MTKIIANIKNALVRRNRISRTVRELNALSDRELQDLGIARGNIYELARQTF